MIDWDKFVNLPIQKVFGELATFQSATGLEFPITGTFHEAYKSLDLSGDTAMTTEVPALGVQLSEFPVKPKQKDLVLITPTSLHGGGTYVVKEVQPNGVGAAVLLLNRMGA